MDHELKTYLDSLQAQLLSMEQRMATKADLEALEQHMATKSDLEAVEQRMVTNLDALGRRMATDLASAVERLDESIKSRKEDENAHSNSQQVEATC